MKLIRNRPLFMMAIVVLIGVVISQNISDIMVVILVLVLMLMLLYHVSKPFIKSKEYCKIAGRSLLLLSALLLTVIYVRTQVSSRESTLSKISDEKCGTVYGQLIKKELRNDKYRYFLSGCCYSQSNKAGNCNKVLVYVKSDEYSIGDTLKIYGQINKFKSAENQGMFDEKAFYMSQKIDFIMQNVSIELIEKKDFSLADFLYELRVKLEKSLSKISDEETLGILSSMLVGDKNYMGEDIKQLYQKTGIAHILAISGMHISLIGMSLYKLLRRFGKSFATSSIVAGTLIIMYGQMTGWTVSGQRAIIMFLISLGAYVLGRVSDMLNSLGIAVIAILLENPFIISYSGFIFSCVAIVAVALSDEYISNSKLSSLLICFFMLPVVAYFYYEIPMYSFLINIIIAPLLGIVFLLGLLAAFVGIYSVKVGFILILPVRIILFIYKLVCIVASKLPFSTVIVGRPAFGCLVVFYSVVLLVLIGREKNPKIMRAFVYIMMFFLIVGTRYKGFEIDVLSVGQGDGIYIQTDVSTVFIDGGSTTVKQVGKYRILPFLKYKGIKSIDYWFVSHADEDHINGLKEVLEDGYAVENLVVSKATVDLKDEALLEIIEISKKSGSKIIYMQEGDCIILGDTKIKCVYPMRSVSTQDRNNVCLALFISNSKMSGIFAGDIPAESEKNLVKYLQKKYKSNKINIDLYKVNHHGSKYSSSMRWLKYFNPKVSVISCGKDNLYGHPHQEAINRITKNNSRIYITSDLGQITIHSDDNGIRVIPYLNQKEN